MTHVRHLGTSFLGIGIALLGLAFWTYRRFRRFRELAVPAEGVVIDFKQRINSDDDPEYFPIFRYRDEAGKEHVICSDTGTNPPGFKKGDSIRVLYDAANPSDCRIDTFWQLWLLPLIFCVLGIAFALVGSIVVIVE